jgi:peptide deformylase
VGLAAPQVNKSIRIFIVDATPYEEDMPEAKGFRKVFINPEIIEEQGDEKLINEGCLSIPGIREDVARPGQVHIQYYDRDWNFYDEWYDGMLGRIIQHEYDHLNGVLFFDRMSDEAARELADELDELETEFRSRQEAGAIPSDHELIAQLAEWETRYA